MLKRMLFALLVIFILAVPLASSGIPYLAVGPAVACAQDPPPPDDGSGIPGVPEDDDGDNPPPPTEGCSLWEHIAGGIACAACGIWGDRISCFACAAYGAKCHGPL